MRYGAAVEEVRDKFRDDVVRGGGEWAVPICPCEGRVGDVVVV